MGLSHHTTLRLLPIGSIPTIAEPAEIAASADAAAAFIS
jgi:hypothetical protein